VITYFDEEHEALKIAICDDPLCDIAKAVYLDQGPGEAGEPNTLRLLPDGRPIVSYHYQNSETDPSVSGVKLVVCQDTMCENAAAMVVAEQKGGQSYLGAHTDMVLTREGLPVILYWDGEAHAVRFALCKDEMCSSRTKKRVRFDWGLQYISVALDEKDSVYFSCHEVRPNRRQLVIYTPGFP
jgi:hypothetical protein